MKKLLFLAGLLVGGSQMNASEQHAYNIANRLPVEATVTNVKTGDKVTLSQFGSMDNVANIQPGAYTLSAKGHNTSEKAKQVKANYIYSIYLDRKNELVLGYNNSLDGHFEPKLAENASV